MSQKHWGEVECFILSFHMAKPIFSLRKHQRSFWWKLLTRDVKVKIPQNPTKHFFYVNLYIYEFLNANQVTSVWEAMCSSQPKCGKNVNLYSFVQHLLFLEVLRQYKWFLFEIGQGKHEWGSCSKATGTSRVGVSWGTKVGWWDRPWVWAGAAFGWGHRELTQGQLYHTVGKGESDSPHLIHLSHSILQMHPQIPAGLGWSDPPSLCLVACTSTRGMKCCGHQSWCECGDTSAFLHPLCHPTLWWQISPPAATEMCWKAVA